MATTWHPILAATEPQPGRWVLVDEMSNDYAEIVSVRRGEEIGYRATMKGPARRLLPHPPRRLRSRTPGIHPLPRPQRRIQRGGGYPSWTSGG